MKDNIMHAFGKTPDIFTQRVESTLLGLEERPMKNPIRKSVILAVAALVTLLGIAAAAGSTNLFSVFGRQPLDGAEKTVEELSSEPIKLNDDITAAIDNYYYDGNEIFYEMTLTLSDPQNYALISASTMPHDYTPPTDITHIYINPSLWDDFELYDELALLTDDLLLLDHSCYESPAALEDNGNGVYKVYGYSRILIDGGLSSPDELDLDVNLQMIYAPQEPARMLTGVESVDAEIPFHAVKTSVRKEYTLTPVSLPEGFTMHSATLKVSAVDNIAEFKFSVERESVDISNVQEMTDIAIRSNNPPSLGHQYYLHDPNDPENLIWLGGNSSYASNGAELKCEEVVIFNAMDPIPDKLTFTITEMQKVDGVWEHVPAHTIEYIVTEVE